LEARGGALSCQRMLAFLYYTLYGAGAYKAMKRVSGSEVLTTYFIVAVRRDSIEMFPTDLQMTTNHRGD